VSPRPGSSGPRWGTARTVPRTPDAATSNPLRSGRRGRTSGSTRIADGPALHHARASREAARPSARSRLRGEEWEGRGELEHLPLHLGTRPVSSGARGRGRSIRRCAPSRRAHPTRGERRRAMRMPLVTHGFCGSSGTAFLFTVMRARWSASSAALPVRFRRRRSTSMRWVSVPPRPGRTRGPPAPRQGAGVLDHPPLVVAEAGLSASPKHAALAAMMCMSGPPCSPGNTLLSTSPRDRGGTG